MKLSICICTYNRARSLAQTLDSLIPAVAGLTDVEIVIVDNNSTDRTQQTIAHYARTLPIVGVFEKRQGLSIARNTAIANSCGELVLFTDDDTRWDDGSIHALLDEARDHPQAGFFGGRILPQWPNRTPKWLHDPTLDLIAGVLGHYDLGAESRPIEASDRLPYGANFTVRRETLNRLGQFDESLGAIGNRIRRGEDTDLIQRAISLGYQGRYVPAALCMHNVDPQNLRLSKLFEVGFEKGLSMDQDQKSLTQHVLRQTTLTVRAFMQLLKGRGDRFRQCVILLGIEHGLRHQNND
jgi:glycosyltransferase involved in cell wall biosynthesis